jgi:hypothetical protein
MSHELKRVLDAVCDEESFVCFLEALAADHADEVAKEKINPSLPYSPGANGWENGTIDAFLEAASEWGRASKDGLQFCGEWVYEKPDNPWKRCADIIYMGKIYE